jgi:hypothetical protein
LLPREAIDLDVRSTNRTLMLSWRTNRTDPTAGDNGHISERTDYVLDSGLRRSSYLLRPLCTRRPKGPVRTIGEGAGPSLAAGHRYRWGPASHPKGDEGFAPRVAGLALSPIRLVATHTVRVPKEPAVDRSSVRVVSSVFPGGIVRSVSRRPVQNGANVRYARPSPSGDRIMSGRTDPVS